jgi:hypothetical protein
MSLEMTHLSEEARAKHRKAVEGRRVANKIQDGGGPKSAGAPPGPLGQSGGASVQSGGGPPPENFGPQSGGAPPGPKKDL